jgi:hypothetical protein
MRLAQQKKMAGDVPMTTAHSKVRSRLDTEDSTISTIEPLSPTNSEESIPPSKSDESIASKYEELQEKLEHLQFDHEDKCNELEDKCNDLVECQNDLKAARMRIQELELLLQSQMGEQRSSIVPDKIAAGNSGPGVASESQEDELRRMFSWLAEHVDLDETITFDASEHALVVAGQPVEMGLICQWRLQDSDLRLTVPEQLASEVSNMLVAAKVDPTTLCDANASNILDSWLLSIHDPPSETTSAVTMLTHRESDVNCIVASFPVPHQVIEYGGYKVGEAVEVDFEGQWFSGFVKLIECHGEFFVQCDVDTPGVLTKCFSHALRRPEVAFAQSEADISISESSQAQSQMIAVEVVSNCAVLWSASRHKMSFSHARTRTCP